MVLHVDADTSHGKRMATKTSNAVLPTKDILLWSLGLRGGVIGPIVGFTAGMPRGYAGLRCAPFEQGREYTGYFLRLGRGEVLVGHSGRRITSARQARCCRRRSLSRLGTPAG